MRMERHVKNAKEVAQFLENHPDVLWVNYPSLQGNKYYNLSQKYLPKGSGSILTFGIKGGAKSGEKFIEALEFVSHLANVGDAKSLIIHPASTTHRQLSEEDQLKAGISPDMIRLSVGLESIKDILGILIKHLRLLCINSYSNARLYYSVNSDSCDSDSSFPSGFYSTHSCPASTI